MLFNSIEFLIFLPIFFTLYWALNENRKAQNWLVLIASYIFYSWWDYRFSFLMLFSSGIDYYTGIKIYESTEKRQKRFFMRLSLFINLGMLFVFKYYNFFVDNFYLAFQSVGIELNIRTLSVILPVGISFYTFQTLSYSLDIYRGKMKPTKDWVLFFAYVAFFPQLVAGPIERASKLLPQMELKKKFDYAVAVDGCRQILWGLFKKVAIADNIAMKVDYIYANQEMMSAPTLYLGAFFFIVQLTTDFSGYSDVAIGLGKLLGVQFSVNFRTPFFAHSVPDFWSRWHLTMTNWFRDYVFVPMALKRKSDVWWQFFSTMVLFVLIGFWHGANWTYIVYGVLQGIYYIPRVFSKNIPWLKSALQVLRTKQPWLFVASIITLNINTLTSIFFRAPDIQSAFGYLSKIFTSPWNVLPETEYLMKLPIIAFFLGIDWIHRKEEHQFKVGKYPAIVRYVAYYLLAFLILYLGVFGDRPFIYFQF